MGFDQYHEPPDELPPETRTFARLCASLTEEAEAIGRYEQRLAVEPNAAARAVMANAVGEGWEHSATSLGRTGPVGESPCEGVTGLRRRVLPLVEVRAAFDVLRAELRAADRGAQDVDLAALDRAARSMAVAENTAVLH